MPDRPEKKPTDSITREELANRVVYALFLPVVRVATQFGVPLAAMKKWMEMAYYHETQRRGMSLKDVMALMNVSLSKAALLSRQLKANFADTDKSLSRRVEYALWAQPLSRARLGQHVKVPDDDLDTALAQLVDEGRVRLVKRKGVADVYELATSGARRVWSSWLARVDGLNNALGSVSDVVYSRFFVDNALAFARTVTLHVRKTDVDELTRFYEEHFWPFLLSLDTKAAGAPDEELEVLSLSVLWARHQASMEATEEDGEPTA